MIAFTLELGKIDALVKFLHTISDNKKHIFFLLRGGLGVGKTTLVREFIKTKLGECIVASPTFSLIQEYENIFHYDFYQKDFGELIRLGFLELFERDGIHFIEWASKELEDSLKNADFEVIEILITANQPLHHREYKITYKKA